MPIHDWTRVDAGLFHAFHQEWISELARALNRGVLPSDYFALPEQNIRGSIPDVITLRLPKNPVDAREANGGVAVAVQKPQTRLTKRAEIDSYIRKASRIVIRHRHGDVVAVIEIISPGNKASLVEFRNLVEKSVDLIRAGIHVLVIDLFPPGRRDPLGLHKAIWDQFQEEDLELPQGKPLTIASYDAGDDCVAYVEFVGIGDLIPDMPLFLRPEIYVSAPLEKSYWSVWEDFPSQVKGLLELSSPNSAESIGADSHAPT